MTATQDIVAKLWGLCNVLRDDGVTSPPRARTSPGSAARGT